MPAALATPKPGPFLVSVAIAALLALLVYHHASTHGSRHATAWGIATFLLGALALPVYFVRYWVISSRRRR